MHSQVITDDAPALSLFDWVLNGGTRSKVLLKDLEVKKQYASIDLQKAASVFVEEEDDDEGLVSLVDNI